MRDTFLGNVVAQRRDGSLYHPFTLHWIDVLVIAAWGVAGLLIAARFFSWEPRGVRSARTPVLGSRALEGCNDPCGRALGGGGSRDAQVPGSWPRGSGVSAEPRVDPTLRTVAPAVRPPPERRCPPRLRTAADCAKNATLAASGTLTVGTDNPAYPPYFEGGTTNGSQWKLNDPTTGKGFESAVAYAVAGKLGFSASQVKWIVAPSGSRRMRFDRRAGISRSSRSRTRRNAHRRSIFRIATTTSTRRSSR